jgi:hypothetical protein
VTRAIAAFNLYTVNYWLRKRCRDAYAKSTPALLARSEFAWSTFYAERPDLPNDEEFMRNHYLSATGIMRRIFFLGPNITQSNLLRSHPISGGSMSADADTTQIAWVARGPTKIHNYWGSDATMVGKHLWLVLRREPHAGAPFQFVPWVSESGFSTTVDDARAVQYFGHTGAVEEAPAIYVGMVIALEGRKPRTRESALEAGGLPVRAPQALAPVRGSYFNINGEAPAASLDECYGYQMHLEKLVVHVHPQAFGMFKQYG